MSCGARFLERNFPIEKLTKALFRGTSSHLKIPFTGYNLSEAYPKSVLRRSHLCFDDTAIAKIKQELTWTQYSISTYIQSLA